jgi:hypothetical protein
MKTQKTKRPAASETLPTAYPPPPGELARAHSAGLTNAEAAGLTKAEPEETLDAGVNLRKVRWIAGLYAALAAVALATGEEFDAMFWASFAFFFALAGESRRRVPKLVRYFALALMVALGVAQLVRWILRARGL